MIAIAISVSHYQNLKIRIVLLSASYELTDADHHSFRE